MSLVKLREYKINAQKSCIFCSLTLKDPEEKLKEIILSYHYNKNNKYLGINLPKEAKDLYSEKTNKYG